MNIHYFHQLKYIFTGLSIVIGVGFFSSYLSRNVAVPFPTEPVDPGKQGIL